LIGVSIGDFDDGVFTVQAEKVVGVHTHHDTFTMRLQDRIVEVEFDVYASELSSSAMAAKWVIATAVNTGLDGANALEWGMDSILIGNAGIDSGLNKNAAGMPIGLLYSWAGESSPHGDSGGNLASILYGSNIDPDQDPYTDLFKLPTEFPSLYANTVEGNARDLIIPKYKKASDIIPGGSNTFSPGGKIVTWNVIVDDNPAGDYDPITHTGGAGENELVELGPSDYKYGSHDCYAFLPAKVATVKVMWAAAIFDEVALDYWTENGSTPEWDIYAKRTISQTAIWTTGPTLSPDPPSPFSVTEDDEVTAVGDTNGIWHLVDTTSNNITITTNFSDDHTQEFLGLRGYVVYGNGVSDFLAQHEQFNWYVDGVLTAGSPSKYYNHYFFSDDPVSSKTIICKHVLADGLTESNGTVGADWTQTVHVHVEQTCNMDVWKNFEVVGPNAGHVELHWWVGDSMLATITADNTAISVPEAGGSAYANTVAGPELGSLDWDNAAAAGATQGPVQLTDFFIHSPSSDGSGDPFYPGVVGNADPLQVRADGEGYGNEGGNLPSATTWSWLGDTSSAYDPDNSVHTYGWDGPDADPVITWHTVRSAGRRRYVTDPSSLPEDQGGFTMTAINTLLNNGVVYYDGDNHLPYPFATNVIYNVGEIKVDTDILKNMSQADVDALLIPEWGDRIEFEGDITVEKEICGVTFTDVVTVRILLENFICDNWNEYSKFDLYGQINQWMPDGETAAFPSFLGNSIEIGNTPSGASYDPEDSFKILPSGYIRHADSTGDVTLQAGGTAQWDNYDIAPGDFGIESSHVTFEWHGQGWGSGNDGSLPGGPAQENPWNHISWISNFGGSVKRIFATGGTAEAIGSFSESAAAALSSLVTYDDVTNNVTYSVPSFATESDKQAFFDALDIPDWKDEGTYYGAAVVTYHPCQAEVEAYWTSYPHGDYPNNPLANINPAYAHTARVPLEIIVVNSQCNAAWWSNNSISPPTVNGFNVAWFDDSAKTTTATLGITIADGSGNNIITITGDETADIRIYDAAGTTYHDPFSNISGGPLAASAPPLNLLSADFVFTWAGTPSAGGTSLLINSVVAYEGGGNALMGRQGNGIWDSHLDGMCHWQVLEELFSWDSSLASENSTVTYTANCILTIDICGNSETDMSAYVEFEITNNLGDAAADSNWHNWGFNLAPTAGGAWLEINQPYNLTHDGEFLATDYPLPQQGADGSITVDTNTLGICMATTVGDAAEAPTATAIEKASGTPDWLPSASANNASFTGGDADQWLSAAVGGATVTDSWDLTSYFKNMTGKVWISGIAIHGDLDGLSEGLFDVTIGGHLFGNFTTAGVSSSPTAIVPGSYPAAYVDIVNGIVDYEFTVGTSTGYLGPGWDNTHAWHMTVSFESPAVAQDDDRSDWVKICREIDAAAAPQGDAGVSNASEGTGTNGEDLTGAWVYIEDFLKFDGADPDINYNTVSIVWWGDDCTPCDPAGEVYGGLSDADGDMNEDSYSTIVRLTLNNLIGWDWLQASTSTAGPLMIDDLSVGAPKRAVGGGTYTFTELYQILEILGFDASSTTSGHPFPIGSVKRFFGWIKLTKRCLGTNSANDGSGVHDQTRYLPISVDIKHALIDPFRCDYWIDNDGQYGPDYPVGLECNMTLGDWIASGNSTHTGVVPTTIHPLLHTPPISSQPAAPAGQDDVSDPDWGTTKDYGVTPTADGIYTGMGPAGSQMVDGLIPVLIVKRVQDRLELDAGPVHSIVWIDLRGSLHPTRTLIQKLENVFINEGLWDGAGTNVPWGGNASTFSFIPGIGNEVYHGAEFSNALVAEHPANCYGVQWFLLCNVWTCGKPGRTFKNTAGDANVEAGLIPGLTGQYPSRTHIGYKVFHPRGIEFDADGNGIGNGTDWYSPEIATHEWMMEHSHYIPEYLIAPGSIINTGTEESPTWTPMGNWKDYAPAATANGDLEVWGRPCQLPATMDKFESLVINGGGTAFGDDWMGYQALEQDMSRLWTDIGFGTQTGTAEVLNPCCPCANLSIAESGSGDLLIDPLMAGHWSEAFHGDGIDDLDSICYRIVLDVSDTGFYPSTASMYGYAGLGDPPTGTWAWNGTQWVEA
jgi:hypothetical protein